MARKKRDTSGKRTSILDAAVQAFVQEGYDVASMDRIAEIAVASKRTVYNHFPSKEALLEAVLDRFLDASEQLKSIPYDPDRSLEEQLSDFIDAKLMTVNNPSWLGLVRLTLGMLIRDIDRARASLARYESGDDALIPWIVVATTDGRIHTTDPKMSATMFWSMVAGALSWPQIIAGPMPSEQVEPLREEIIQTFLSRHCV